jgi:hypothetical protein
MCCTLALYSCDTWSRFCVSFCVAVFNSTLAFSSLLRSPSFALRGLLWGSLELCVYSSSWTDGALCLGLCGTARPVSLGLGNGAQHGVLRLWAYTPLL